VPEGWSLQGWVVGEDLVVLVVPLVHQLVAQSMLVLRRLQHLGLARRHPKQMDLIPTPLQQPQL